MKEYTLKAWADPSPLPNPRRAYANRRKRCTGPDAERVLMREGAWPEFIKKKPYTGPPKPRGRPRRLTDEQRSERKRVASAKSLERYHATKTPERLAQMRARSKAQYDKMTPEQKAAKRAAHVAFLKANPEKKREYNARYNAKKKAKNNNNNNNI